MMLRVVVSREICMKAYKQHYFQAQISNHFKLAVTPAHESTIPAASLEREEKLVKPVVGSLYA